MSYTPRPLFRLLEDIDSNEQRLGDYEIDRFPPEVGTVLLIESAVRRHGQFAGGDTSACV